jgi:hypothetical protein
MTIRRRSLFRTILGLALFCPITSVAESAAPLQPREYTSEELCIILLRVIANTQIRLYQDRGRFGDLHEVRNSEHSGTH